MYFISILLLCICNSFHATEQSSDYNLSAFSNELSQPLYPSQDISTESSTTGSSKSNPNTYKSVRVSNPNRSTRSAKSAKTTLCPICNKNVRYNTKDLRRHLATSHYRCSRCDYTKEYPDRDTFIAHLLSKHKITSSYIINYLLIHNNNRQSPASAPNDLDQALCINKMYRNKKVCPIMKCYTTFTKATSIRIHMATKHNRCEICDCMPQFSTPAELYTHVISTHRNANALITYLSKKKYVSVVKSDPHKQESLSNICHDHREDPISYFDDNNNVSMALPFEPLFNEVIDDGIL